MAGIYIHIPFCKKKCHYCNFFSVASLTGKHHILPAIADELHARRDYLGGDQIETIYFGGGTPSLLSGTEIDHLMKCITRDFSVAANAEITLEANPDDLSAQKLSELHKTGINRLSIGIQSFYNDDLEYLNRAHDAGQALAAVKAAQSAGFSNITLDLIYGIPTLSDEHWVSNILKAISLGVQHISAYSLTVESRTPLEYLIRKGKAKPVEEEQSIRHFELLTELMRENEFIHYEISNFCLEGWYARHNTNYWNGSKYLGVGPSAHSYDGSTRQWNASGITPYVEAIMKGTGPDGAETLSTAQHYNEYVMTSLRTIWGCNLDEISKRYGESYAQYIRKLSVPHLLDKKLVIENGILRIIGTGLLMADAIASDLFVTE
jgi:putative oxygen-independent coproporphyrinogen III oxidase